MQMACQSGDGQLPCVWAEWQWSSSSCVSSTGSVIDVRGRPPHCSLRVSVRMISAWFLFALCSATLWCTRIAHSGRVLSAFRSSFVAGDISASLDTGDAIPQIPCCTDQARRHALFSTHVTVCHMLCAHATQRSMASLVMRTMGAPEAVIDAQSGQMQHHTRRAVTACGTVNMALNWKTAHHEGAHSA